MPITIPGFRVVKSDTIERIEQDLRWHKNRGDRLSEVNQTLGERITELTTQLESERNLSKSLGAEKLELHKQIDFMTDELADGKNLLSAAQTKIQKANTALYMCGKHLMRLQVAWQKRQLNPKMGPRERVANNKDISDSLILLRDELPKKIELTDPVGD